MDNDVPVKYERNGVGNLRDFDAKIYISFDHALI